MTGPRTLLSAVAVLLLAATACSTDNNGTTTDTDASGGGSEPGATGCAPSRPDQAGTRKLSYEHDGVMREYELTVPASYDGTAAAPLVLDLHGFSSNASQQSVLSGLPGAAGDRGYVVVTPQALEVDVPLTTGTLTTTFWNIDPAAVRPGFEPPDDLAFLDELLDEVEADLCIDPERLYATGMSNGAGMTMALICGDDTRFAAAAPVAGVNLRGECEPGESISVLAFHGDADPLIPYGGGSVVGQDYEVTGVEERVGALAALAGCAAEPTVDMPFDDIETRTWDDCDDGIAMQLTSVVGGGHTWPGTAIEFPDDPVDDPNAPSGQQDFLEGFDFSTVAGHETQNIEATKLILDFFDAHPGTA